MQVWQHQNSAQVPGHPVNQRSAPPTGGTTEASYLQHRTSKLDPDIFVCMLDLHFVVILYGDCFYLKINKSYFQ